MNWGWGGSADGWYLGDDVNTTNGMGNYSASRENLYITKK